ncbi:MAG: tetratricopeptide repeat protein [Alphaproteobacteria bacterium]|nr:tetratricopeptide repeat protein [Alphaproteobacteria bacterium]
MVDSNESFLREIKEEIDRERIENLWKRYGTLIVGAGALVVVAVAGFQIWNSMQQRAAHEAGAAYEQALNAVFAKNLDEAATKFSEIAKSGPSGYALLAGMQAAATLAEQGKTAEAIAEFETIAKRDGGDQLFKGFATLQAAALRIGDADFNEMQNRLAPLIKDGEPWRFNAQELLAVAAVKAGEFEAAKAGFEKILAEPDVPPAMRQRANLRMLQIAGSDGAAASSEAQKSEGSATAAGGDEAKASGEAAPASTK